MLAVHRRGDPVEVGWAAAVMTNELLRIVWAVNDLPNPPSTSALSSDTWTI
ncbi:hypothetical protein [Actinophytocola sp.]|uniref:hypothetical protein n=1 Tax=Actinophytocola sp. TaxID=1872138 RepID=UPI002ED35F0C